jgi:predicted  nucleic acid-binding Zn-ribbon protein
MGMLGGALEALKSVVFLQEEVKRLGNNVSKIAEHVDHSRIAIARLEAQQQSAITIAQQAAQASVANDLVSIRERVTRIEAYLAMREAATRDSVLLPSSNRSEIGVDPKQRG